MTDDRDRALVSAFRILEQEAPDEIKSSAKIERPSHRNSAVKDLEDALSAAAATITLAPPKPVLRILHHLACVGGTLIAKAISAQPNVALLSEVDPFSPLGDTRPFRPTDMIGLAKLGSQAATHETQAKLFKASIDVLARENDAQGTYLVLREHNHGKYSYGNDIGVYPGLRAFLHDAYDLKSVLTVRNPIDSFLSLKANGWDLFSPNSFEEYCRRMLVFLDDHDNVPIIRYEDFISDPQTVCAAMCEALQLPFNPNFVTLMSAISLSGDSGRKGTRLKLRPRRAVPDALVHEFEKSAHHTKLAKRLGYSTALDDSA